MDDFEIGSVALARDRPCSSAPKKIQRTSHLKAVQGQRKPAERQWKDSARLKEASAKTAERQCKVKERQRKDSGKAAQGQRKAVSYVGMNVPSACHLARISQMCITTAIPLPLSSAPEQGGRQPSSSDRVASKTKH